MVTLTTAESLRRKAYDYRQTAERHQKLLDQKLASNPLYEVTSFRELAIAEFRQFVHLYIHMAEEADAFAAILEAEILERQMFGSAGTPK